MFFKLLSHHQWRWRHNVNLIFQRFMNDCSCISPSKKYLRARKSVIQPDTIAAWTFTDDGWCWLLTVFGKFLRRNACRHQKFSRHESPEAHSSKWQIVMKSWPSVIPVCKCAQVEASAAWLASSIPSHHFTQQCLCFPLPGAMSK